MQKSFLSVLCVVILISGLTPIVAKASEVEESQGINLVDLQPLNNLNTRSSNGYVSKNYSQTNYKVKTEWKYSYSFTAGMWGFSKKYDVFNRRVSYTVSYDLYDRHSGNFIRRVTSNYPNALEEKSVVSY